MTKKQLTWLFVALLLLVGGSAIWYFFFRDECDPNNNGFTKKGKLSDKCKFNDPALKNKPSPDGSNWTPDTSFPIKKGSWGAKVAGLQKALGFPEGKCATCADGEFGPYTEGKLKAKTGKTEVATQADYDKIVSPVKPVSNKGGDNYEAVKKNLAGKWTLYGDSAITTTVSGKNNKYNFEFYSNGRFFVWVVGSGMAPEVAKGTYTDGGTKMYVDGGESYGNWVSHPVADNMASIVKDIE